MKALCWHGTTDLRIEDVPEPKLLNPRDAIIRVTSTTICGSDLHIYDGFIPTMHKGDILGHEFMGEVVEVGPGVRQLKVGQRVVVPSTIACGGCEFCKRELWSLCDNSNPHAELAATVFGAPTSGIFGYSHLFGGYAGSHAEYIRVPYADVGPIVVDGFSDDEVLFCSDAFPTGYMAADNCQIRPGDVVAVWGAGAVGLFAMISARLLGAERVIAIDRYPERLALAEKVANAEVVNYESGDLIERLREMTGGRGPDACIDAVGLEAHAATPFAAYDKIKTSLRLENDRPYVLREIIQACRKGGTLSVMGVYSGMVDKLQMGVAFNKGLTIRMGQMHGQKYARLALDAVREGLVNCSFAVSHHMPLSEGAAAFELFKHKHDHCLRVVLNA